MGWHKQGYLESATSSTPLWIVDCGNGEYQPDIQAYSGKNPLPVTTGSSLRIYYGTTGLEYFRGFGRFSSLAELKQELQLFNSYPVYKTKWHGRQTFEPAKLEFYAVEGLLFFVERRSWKQGGWRECVEDLFWHCNQLNGTNFSFETTAFYK